jgi:hypothetical protein
LEIEPEGAIQGAVQKSYVPHIDLPRNRGGDEGAAALLEQGDGAFRLRLQLVDLPVLPVQMRDDGALLGEGWEKLAQANKTPDMYLLLLFWWQIPHCI